MNASPNNTIDLSIPGPLFLFLDRQKVHHLFPSIDHGQWTKAKQELVLHYLPAIKDMQVQSHLGQCATAEADHHLEALSH